MFENFFDSLGIKESTFIEKDKSLESNIRIIKAIEFNTIVKGMYGFTDLEGEKYIKNLPEDKKQKVLKKLIENGFEVRLDEKSKIKQYDIKYKEDNNDKVVILKETEENINVEFGEIITELKVDTFLKKHKKTNAEKISKFLDDEIIEKVGIEFKELPICKRKIITSCPQGFLIETNNGNIYYKNDEEALKIDSDEISNEYDEVPGIKGIE